MRFHSLEEAEEWLVSVDGWFETRSTVSDDDQGYVMANKRTGPDKVVSRPGYFKNGLTGETRQKAIQSARIDACEELRAYLGSAEE